MTKAKLESLALGGSADDVEAAFYEAMQTGDIQRMMACWADEDDIVCVHPGGPRLCGVQAIRTSFESLFAAGTVHAQPERVRRLQTMTSSLHSVLERVRVQTQEGPRDAFVIATNAYIKTAQGWRMVAHHASPGTVQEMSDTDGPPQVLH